MVTFKAQKLLILWQTFGENLNYLLLFVLERKCFGYPENFISPQKALFHFRLFPLINAKSPVARECSFPPPPPPPRSPPPPRQAGPHPRSAPPKAVFRHFLMCRDYGQI